MHSVGTHRHATGTALAQVVYSLPIFMSCLSRVGCVTVLVVGAAGAWWLYGGSMPSSIPGLSRITDKASATASTGKQPVAWATLSSVNPGPNGRDIVAQLDRPTGPAYVTLGSAELASLIASGLSGALPSSARDAQVAVDDDLVRVRAVVPLSALGGGAVAALIGGAVSDRDTVELAGSLEMVRAGVAQFRVRELRVRSIEVPPRLIGPLMRTLRSRTVAADSISENGVAVPLPKSIADIRVARGKVTLYKTAPKP